jgi:hypothetical protein
MTGATWFTFVFLPGFALGMFVLGRLEKYLDRRFRPAKRGYRHLGGNEVKTETDNVQVAAYLDTADVRERFGRR